MDYVVQVEGQKVEEVITLLESGNSTRRWGTTRVTNHLIHYILIIGVDVDPFYTCGKMTSLAFSCVCLNGSNGAFMAVAHQEKCAAGHSARRSC